jgi:hypothetical protein
MLTTIQTLSGETLRLRPLTLRTFMLLEKTGNEFLQPKAEGGNIAYASSEYVHMHTWPPEDIEEQIAESTLRHEVLALADRIPFPEIVRIQAAVNQVFADVQAARTEVAPKPDSGEKGAPGN